MKQQSVGSTGPDGELLKKVGEVTASPGDWLERQDYAGNDPYQLDQLISRVDLARQHMVFAMDRFYAWGGKFRYKAFENGDSNNAVFICWTQAPMYKAIVRYLRMSAAKAA